MKINPAPRFIHAVGIEAGENVVNGVVVVEHQSCAMARVVTNNSALLSAIPAGAIVFVRAENTNAIRVDADGINVIIFEDAVMGWCDEAALGAPVKIVAYTPPTKIVKAAPRGMSIPLQ